MKVIDLTHTISENMPVYPGTEKPKLGVASTYKKDGFKETLITMFSHTGTHMDSPAHLFSQRTTLDSFNAEQFVGKGIVVDCSNLKEGQKITMKYIEDVKEKADIARYILFYTGWDKYWGTDAYFGNYPYITEEVAEYLIKSKKKGVGIDVIGIDPIKDENLTIHKKLFAETDIVVIENLTSLDKVGNDIFTFCALPIKFKDSDGAPVRAVAILED
ncbi:cyclase family protein [Clostridium beijerinckii]|uniref:cyclase family protein n=1 Tax=Clostridium beijerinckii TaxID=1520 RepID=UPI00098C35EB|nr:cyclase family protein [Clostridium beijerinckii]MBA8933434.1 kynurenine formamidase [Clostridium beijerinckii]NRT36621.1 kynurenine formamidase [Clostridium beijerinckii]NRT43947.1 kynurenine formamidase [Clostridium beijerinckii]NRU37634.1 kynurenine formamidase [Clostridium beijerinckii]NRZ22060.1 kynurenine formamidase [Clostridium beijerinckii]